MKRILFALLFCSAAIGAQAQCFGTGDNIFSAGFGLGVYNSTLKNLSTNTSDTSDDKAAAKLFSLTYEHGLTSWLGVGATFSYGSYIASEDSFTHTTPSARAIDIMATANAHFAKGDKAEAFASVNLGFSSFNYANNLPSPSDNTLSGGGFVLDLRLHGRLYFGGGPVALGINAGYMSYSYGNLTDKNSNNYSFKLSGPVFGATLTFRMAGE